MGPFSGAGVELMGILLFGAIAFGIWVFNAGRRSATGEEAEAPKSPSVAPAPQCENVLTCDQCAKETDRLLQRENGPQLGEACFKLEPLIPRHNQSSGQSSASGEQL